MSDGGAEYTFACRVCEEQLVVNESMRNALMERGCVLCGAPVSADAFTDETPTESG